MKVNEDWMGENEFGVFPSLKLATSVLSLVSAIEDICPGEPNPPLFMLPILC